MNLTWRERLRQCPRLAEFSAWPPLDPGVIPKKERKAFLRNQRIVKSVLAGSPLSEVATFHGVSPGRVTQLLDRCLGGPVNAPPSLLRGLVPHQVLNTHHPDRPERGQFARLLQDVPGLRAGLDGMLLDRLKDSRWAEVPSPGSYHALFKHLLAQANWPLDRYPYTTDSLAYESVRRDLHARWTLLCQAAKTHRTAFKALPGPAPALQLYDRIEIDEQIIDCQQSAVGIEISIGEQLPPMRLPRLTLLAAIDVATDCILGFRLALTKHPTQDHLLGLLQECLHRGAKRQLSTPGLTVSPESGFPNTQTSLPLPLPREIALDNAWMHHASSVEVFVTQELGATLSYGRPGSPTVRRAIEQAFNRVNQQFTHRLASTTGSSVTDPKRESAKNRKGQPVVSLPVFEEELYVTLAEANNRPRPNLATATPLSAMRFQADRVFGVAVDDDIRAQWNPFSQVKTVTLHDQANPERKPYINFEYLKYKGPGLLAVPPGEKKVVVRYDRRDIRELEVFRCNGQPLGPVRCPGTWQSFAHGIGTRRYLFQRQRALIRRSLDPLTEHLYRQREQARSPTALARFLSTYQEFISGFGLPTSLWPKSAQNTDPEDHKPLPAKGPSTKAARRTMVPPRKRYWSISLNPGAKP
ncbi:hypothetical protein EDB94_0324 [Marinobacter sp. 3-2]|jgi:hypothetical protein|uniref:hypothetical protein n=1 Tax=Marinobacter sp. 3-2 TaxID=2485141 RepID=UPI000D3825B7|nr:hypothetical protein [Marinobacter sp. 3-2]ROQ48457.1 hypothetical protein EDB94_0324 [Marinobacter sp. 3-2]